MRSPIRFAAVFLAVIAGCDKGKKDASATSPEPAVAPATPVVAPAAPVPPIQSDPVASFKSFAAKFVTYENGVYANGFDPLPPKIDVQKTDSLISPIVGVLTLSYRMSDSNGAKKPPGDQDNGAGIGDSVKKSTFMFVIEDGLWAAQSAVGDTTIYDKNGAPMPIDIGGDSEADRLAEKARTEPLPDLESAKKDAANLQK